MAKRMINILLSLMMVFALVGTNTGFSVKAEEKEIATGVIFHNDDIVNFGENPVCINSGSVSSQKVKGKYTLSYKGKNGTQYEYKFSANEDQSLISFSVYTNAPSDEQAPSGIIASGKGSDAEPYTFSAYYYASVLNLNQSSLTLVKGEQGTLTATVLPEYANDKTVTWSSDNTNAATVDETGLVTAVAVGTATITATTSNGISKSCIVTVDGKPVKGISLNKNSMTLSVNSQGAIAITDIQPSDADNKTVTWSSSNSSVADITEQKEGYVVVSGRSEGTATITATATNGTEDTSDDVSASCDVTVANGGGQDISVGTTWRVGDSINLNGKDFYLNDKEETHWPITNWGQVTDPVYLDTTNQWRFENVFRDVIFDVAPNPMSVHILIGVSEGKSSGDKPSGFKIASGEGTDTNPYKFKLVYDVTGITLNKESTTILEGNTDTLTATVLPESADNITVTWSSDTPGVATVDENGVVTGVKAGTATITATATNGTDDTEDDKTAKCKVTVKAADVKEYDLWVGGTRVTSSNKDDVLGDGTVSFDPERNILTLNNANISNSSYGIKAEGIDLIINATGENTVNGDDDGIKVTGKLSITGGTITSHGVNRGIYADRLEVTGGTVTASGSSYGINGNTLTFSGGKVIATASGTAVQAENEISIIDPCKITEPVSGDILGTKGYGQYIGIPGGSSRQNVVIDSNVAPEVEYSITINELQHGKVESDTVTAKENDIVTLTVTPDDNYMLKTLIVSTEAGGSIDVTKDETTYSFTMPAANVTVNAEFEIDNSIKVGNEYLIGDEIPFTGTRYYIWKDKQVNYRYLLQNELILSSMNFQGVSWHEWQVVFKDIAIISFFYIQDSNPNQAIGIRVSDGDGTYDHPFSFEVIHENHITIEKTDNGTVTANKTQARDGVTITLTATPEEGYALDSLTATDNKGNSIELKKVDDKTYSFTMPASNVTVNAVFKEGEKSWEYSVEDNVITATRGSETATLTLEAEDKNYDGNPISASVTPSDNWKTESGLPDPSSLTITYDPENTGDAGEYTASISLPSDVIATKKVTVRKASQAAPDAADITSTKASSKTAEDAAISGVNSAMEYSTDNGKTYQSVKGNTISGLRAGDVVMIRYAGDKNHEAGEPLSVTIGIVDKTYAPVKKSLTWTKGASTGVAFQFKGSRDDGETYRLFTEVQIDGTAVAVNNYNKSSGSVIIDFKPSYLETLSEGTHTVKATFEDGSATAELIIKKKDATPDKKSSDGGSSDKKSTTPTDNVVTCQMAGYPANYAWNESAKACQAGYIDASGNFRPYSSRVIPNTYDGGLTRYVWMNVISLILALACGTILMRNR